MELKHRIKDIFSLKNYNNYRAEEEGWYYKENIIRKKSIPEIKVKKSVMGCYYHNRLVQLSEITKQTSLKSACKKTFKHHWWLWTLEWEKIMKNICEPISEAGRQLCQTLTTIRFSLRRQYHLSLRVYLLFIYWYFCLKIITTSHLNLQALFQRGSNVFLSK